MNTAAQRLALQWVAQVNGSEGVTIPTPRADVLRRLAAAGMITRTVRTYRPRNCDRWRSEATHHLTPIGIEELAR